MSTPIDTFAKDRLPPRESWPELVFDLPELRYPDQLNAASELLAGGHGGSPCVWTDDGCWTYRELDERSNQIARVLVEDLGVVPGDRVLLRAPNSAVLIACWLAVLKVGAIAVATMPMLRSRELLQILDKAAVSRALCDIRLTDELSQAAARSTIDLQTLTFGDGGDLHELAQAKPTDFAAFATNADDVALIAFTSGTTGEPKGCVHFHRDILATCDTYGGRVLVPRADDVFVGTAPMAFTFGLGGLVFYPLRFGASTAPIATPGADALVDTIERCGATFVFTAPTMYRTLLSRDDLSRLRTLKTCVSAGEPLPEATWLQWFERTGLRIADGIGSTELLHVFITAVGEDARPGATGRVVPGYEACVLDDQMQPLGIGEVGRLAVKGPTGCRYLDDERQRDYVQDGWNLTGDAYSIDAEGYFHFAGRTDDLIVSAGYNISGIEVESALLSHPDVAECAVVGSPDERRGQVVKAFVVLGPDAVAGAEQVATLQDHVKKTIAPYKYPRAIEFVESLPRTPTGKLQRYKLRERERERAARVTPAG